MFTQSPADELAELRAEIARLRAREGALREAYLRDAALPRIGRWHKVELVTQRQRVFEPRLLPEAIRLDPTYSREKVKRVLRTSRKPAGLPALVSSAPEVDLSGVAARPPRTRFLAALAAH